MRGREARAPDAGREPVLSTPSDIRSVSRSIGSMAQQDRRPGPGGEPRRDPTLVRNQPALRSSTGRVWLIVGAIMAAICFVVLLLQLRNSVPLAVLGAIVVAVLYGALVLVRLLLPQPPRLVVMACFFAAIPVWTIVWLVLIIARMG